MSKAYVIHGTIPHVRAMSFAQSVRYDRAHAAPRNSAFVVALSTFFASIAMSAVGTALAVMAHADIVGTLASMA